MTSRGRFDRLWLIALPLYVIALFAATHVPTVRPPTDLPHGDKLVHFAAFGVLAFMWWQFMKALGYATSRTLALGAAGLVAYAALDEYLQQFVGRHTDVLDFAADSAGILLVLGVIALVRRRWRRPR